MITVEKARDRLHRQISKIGDEALPDLLSIADAENGASGRFHPVIEGFEARVTKALKRGFRRMAKAAVREERAVAKSAKRSVRKEEVQMDMVAIAKQIAEEGPRAYPSVTKAMLYTEMAKRAEATCRAGETPEGAFARFATTTDDGRALMAAYKVAGGEDYRPASFAPAAAEPVVTSAAYQKLTKKAEELRRIHPEPSEAQAFSKVYEAAENCELVNADRAAHYQKIGRALGSGSTI